MLSKNIVFTDVNCARLLEEPVRELKDDEVLVRLAVSSVSAGTERALLTGSRSVSWNRPESEKAIFPRRTGYSSAGTVEQVGAAVTGIAPGDRVALSWSTYSQHAVISQKNVYPIGDIDFADAALFHIASFPLAAIRKCRLEIGESAIVMGMGMLGMIAVQLLRAAGAAPVIAVDPDAGKREKALRSGADFALDPYGEDFSETVKRITGGGANVGIEVTGVGAGLNGILDCMARFGRVALLGCTRDSDFTVDYYRKVHGPGITLIGAHTMARPQCDSRDGWWSQHDDMRALTNLSRMERLHLSRLVDEVHTPEAAPEVYTRLATQKVFPLVQFDWREME